MTSAAFSRFHSLIARWFTEHIGRPTDVQQQAWPRIASGEHVLITAPTGTGKTLAAFLWAINQLATGQWPVGRTSVLYVSPLKALNNDIRRNLLVPLRELDAAFERAGQPFPQVHVLTRSGDTPQEDRRRMLRHPPEVLITTPESLNLLLSSTGGRSILRSLSTVILDEVHAVFGTKRGAHLITAVDRLVRLSGEFQRIALSATIRPLETVAAFVGGYRLEGDKASPHYSPRPVAIVRSAMTKQYELRVATPEEAPQAGQVWDQLAEEARKIIAGNRSTLVFTNSRRLCEMLTLRINREDAEPIAYAHHGALSREIRTEVEHKLKAGGLRAIVATNSLELGIDIGALDEVVLIQSPPSISSTIQRIGRAGHQVGQVSRGALFPAHPRDLLNAAVLVPAVLAQDIEESKPVECPLDVLAQMIVSMVGTEVWDIDELYAQIRTSHPYRSLSCEQFDLVLNMLAGRYADSRIRELKPRVSIDRTDSTVVAQKGALQALYLSGGMIPDRGYFHLRHHQTNAKIGELDEEFVWEAEPGKAFTLGAQSWRIQRITHSDVFVSPAGAAGAVPPFWRGEQINRDFHFSERIGEFLELADQRLDDPAYAAMLQRDNCMEPVAAEQLIAFLKRQKSATGGLPHRHLLVIELCSSGPQGAPGNQVILHTLWGGRVNRPFALALGAAWEARFGQHLEACVGDDSIAFLLPHEVAADELLSLVTSSSVESLLRKRLEASGFFGARFRECAGRALLVTRDSANRRMPLWLNRLRSQKLLDAVMRYEDFPILLEAWRSCLQDEFDLPALRRVLGELESGAVRWAEAHTPHPSPLAEALSWGQINEYVYMDDTPQSARASSLRSDLLRDVVFTPGLRPAVSRELIEQFGLKRRRLYPGYSPETPRELLDWVKERLLIPASEWRELLVAMERDHGADAKAVAEPVASKLVRIIPPGAPEPLIAALETLPRIVRALYPAQADVRVQSLLSETPASIPQDGEPSEGDNDELFASVLSEWLRFYGPKSPAYVATTLGVDRERLRLALEDLIDARKLVEGQLAVGVAEIQVCDSEDFELLLRTSRAAARPAFEPIDLERLALFLASHQGLAQPGSTPDALFGRLEQLLCYPMPAGLWEADILPARLRPYAPGWLDAAMQQGDLRWVGTQGERIAFCFEGELDLVQCDADAAPDASGQAVDALFPDPAGRYDFSTLLRVSGLSPAELCRRLWEAVWQGRVTNDTFLALRKGIETQFQVPPVAPPMGTRRGRGRGAFARWRSALPFAGNWLRLACGPPTDDLLETEELKRDRARLLLDRYGIVFRELLQREAPGFRWSDVFRSLRLMELAGEVLAGCFFSGVPGLQFASHKAFRMLQRKLPDDAIYWINAADPASLCGLPLDPIRGSLPRRLPGTHLVYHGCTLVLVSERTGRELTFRVPPDAPRMREYLDVLFHLVAREFQPLRQITIETINGGDAAGSLYVDPLRGLFDVTVDYRNVVLHRRLQ